MRTISALVGALALGGCATVACSSTSWIDDGYPPARFQTNGINTVHYGPLTDTPCGHAAPGYELEGCSSADQVWLPNPCSKEFRGQSFARVACHELGHTNGWPGDHPRP